MVTGTRTRRLVHPVRTSASRSILILFGSVLFVSAVTVVIHELGHWVVDRWSGVDAALVFELFGGSRTIPEGPIPAEFALLAAAAGPLANILSGLAVFAVSWPRRGPLLLPLLLWAPVALLQESVTAAVQTLTSEPGTDFVLMAAFGVPEALIWLFVGVGLVGGVAGLALLAPVAGVPAADTPATAGVKMSVGLAGYYLVALLVALVASGDLPIRAGQLLLVVLLAFIGGVISRRGLFTRTPDTYVSWSAVGSVAGLGLLSQAVLMIL